MNEKEFSDALKKIEREERWAEWQKAAEEYGDTKVGTRQEYIARFRQNLGLEKKYCPALNEQFGFHLKIENDKITDATMRSAAAAERSDKRDERADRREWLKVWIAAGVLLVMLATLICRGCPDASSTSESSPRDTSESVNTERQGRD